MARIFGAKFNLVLLQVSLFAFFCVGLPIFADAEQLIAPSDPEIIEKIESTEIWLRSPDRTTQEVKSGAIQLAEDYLNAQKYQEAIWILNFAGLKKRSSALEEQLSRIMSSNDLVPIKDLPGSEGKKLVRLGNTDVYGVFTSDSNLKKYEKKYIHAEDLAYRIDRYFNFNLVSFSILLEQSSLGRGMIQYFVKDTISGSEFYSQQSKKGVPLYSTHANYNYGSVSSYPLWQKALWLLDYLLHNTDRKGANWLVRPGNLVVAIDQGIILDRDAAGVISLQRAVLPIGKILKKLKKFKASDLNGIPLGITNVMRAKNEIIDYAKKFTCSRNFKK